MKKNIFPIICVGASLLAIFDLPYRYYELLRWLFFLISYFYMVSCFKHEFNRWGTAFLLLTVFFNPIYPVQDDKLSWQIRDVATVVFFITFTIKFRNRINLLGMD